MIVFSLALAVYLIGGYFSTRFIYRMVDEYQRREFSILYEGDEEHDQVQNDKKFALFLGFFWPLSVPVVWVFTKEFNLWWIE